MSKNEILIEKYENLKIDIKMYMRKFLNPKFQNLKLKN